MEYEAINLTQPQDDTFTESRYRQFARNLPSEGSYLIMGDKR